MYFLGQVEISKRRSEGRVHSVWDYLLTKTISRYVTRSRRIAIKHYSMGGRMAVRLSTGLGRWVASLWLFRSSDLAYQVGRIVNYRVPRRLLSNHLLGDSLRR